MPLQARFPMISPPPLPFTSKYDRPVAAWKEAASLCNFNVYSDELMRRFKLFKKAFKGELTMRDEYGTLYSRAVIINSHSTKFFALADFIGSSSHTQSAPTHSLNLFNDFHQHYLMATKHNVNIWDILNHYPSTEIKKVRTIYSNAKRTAGSAAGWSPITFSTMLQATREIKYFLYKNIPFEVLFISLVHAFCF